MRRIHIVLLFLLLVPSMVLAWSNGPRSNPVTDTPEDCQFPPYGTYDWFAEQALAMMPLEQKAWLIFYKREFLLGTEAPDNDRIPTECRVAGRGYKDRENHKIVWSALEEDFAQLNGRLLNGAAVRAQEEYNKALVAYFTRSYDKSAYYLGAASHYIANACQWGHTLFKTKNHYKFGRWVNSNTENFRSPAYRKYLQLDQLQVIVPYRATVALAKITAQGRGKILPAIEMDAEVRVNDQDYIDSVGHSLNLCTNTIADMLYSFYIQAVLKTN